LLNLIRVNTELTRAKVLQSPVTASVEVSYGMKENRIMEFRG